MCLFTSAVVGIEQYATDERPTPQALSSLLLQHGKKLVATNENEISYKPYALWDVAQVSAVTFSHKA